MTQNFTAHHENLINPPSIQIPDDAWIETGPEDDDNKEDPECHDPGARLLATIAIKGCTMHLEAYALAKECQGDSTAEQRFAPVYGEDSGAQHAFYTLTDGAAQTVTIRGREYVLVAFPHQS